MEHKKVLINERFLSIPPRLSVSWKDIASLYMKGDGLHLNLKEGEQIVLNDLGDEVIDAIFEHHAAFLERRAEERHREMMGPMGALGGTLGSMMGQGMEGPLGKMMQTPEGMDPIVRIGFPPLDAMGMLVQHNPHQKDAPPLPQDLLDKVSGVIRLLADDQASLPKPEANCHCFHCQIAKALHPEGRLEEIEEEILPSELTFSDWEVTEAGEKLYSVQSKLNLGERYSVFLGTPVGCTCGRTSCEHVVAALKS